MPVVDSNHEMSVDFVPMQEATYLKFKVVEYTAETMPQIIVDVLACFHPRMYIMCCLTNTISFCVIYLMMHYVVSQMYILPLDGYILYNKNFYHFPATTTTTTTTTTTPTTTGSYIL